MYVGRTKYYNNVWAYTAKGSNVERVIGGEMLHATITAGTHYYILHSRPVHRQRVLRRRLQRPVRSNCSAISAARGRRRRNRIQHMAGVLVLRHYHHRRRRRRRVPKCRRHSTADSRRQTVIERARVSVSSRSHTLHTAGIVVSASLSETIEVVAPI